MNKSFPTKTGYCHVYPDRIEIVRSGLVGSISNFFFGKGIHRLFGVYLFVIILLGLSLMTSLAIENYLLSFFFVGMIGFYGWNLWKSRDLSAAPIIQRDQINKVEFHKAIQGVTRAYFTIHYTPNKKILRRMVMLPSILKNKQNGEIIADAAYRIMHEEGLLE